MILLDVLDPAIMRVAGPSQCITDRMVSSWR